MPGWRHAKTGVHTPRKAHAQTLGQRRHTDAEGMSLYLFEADGELNSTCYDACAQAWPPLLSEGESIAGEGLDKGMLATFKRTDGSTQIAYNGKPLYYFARDQSAGDTKGQDIEGFGAEWYLISPEGEKVEEEE
jgi:predicted lipoprotein with Yx(FWY)xxD motif